MMTINDIRDQLIEFQGYKKIQFWRNDEPIVIYEGESFPIGKESKYLDWEIIYMFPFMVNDHTAGICIEVSEKE